MSHLSEEQLDQLIAAERAREQEPLNEWRTIAARAREEGLIAPEAGSRWSSGQPWLQAAAAVLLMVGGIAIGRTTIGLPTANQTQTAAATNTTTGAVATNPSSIATPASATQGNTGGTLTFTSVDEASAALERAVREYQTASQYLAANNIATRTRDSAAFYSARAAALDKIANATESALQTAPHDPVINQYYLATMGARAATRQVVSTAALRGF
jgi:hypothetical protein